MLKAWFTEGFSFYFDGDLTAISKNLISVIQLFSVVEAQVFKQNEVGRIAGPFEALPFKKFRISPLGGCSKESPQ